MLFHISENPDIEVFHPRAPKPGEPSVVWAISENRIQNYLLPRECPRVTFYANERSSASDIDTFLGQSGCVVAVERSWIARIKAARLFCYHLPAETFSCKDECAGYFTSKESVIPVKIEMIDDLVQELALRRIEFRILSELWHLHDAVANSTLAFSMIRMRNAIPRNSS